MSDTRSPLFAAPRSQLLGAYRSHAALASVRVGGSVRQGPLPGLVVVRAACDSSGVGPLLRALGMNRPSVHGDAGLAPAVGLIRSLSAIEA